MSAYTYEMIRENNRLPVRFAYVAEPARTILAHWHDYLEILLIVSGGMTAVIQAETYELSAGDILIINSKDIHMTRTHGDTTAYILLQISALYLQQYFPNFDALRFGTQLPSGTAPAGSDCVPSNILMEMLDIYRKEEDGYPLLFTARLHDLLFCLYRYDSFWLASDGQKGAYRDILRITQTMEWVGECYRDELTLEEAAGNLGLSREYFCRLFRKYAGQTFLEYVNSVRVMRFHDELMHSHDSITNLMAAHGIRNYKIFLRTFKRIYGETPRQMRKESDVNIP